MMKAHQGFALGEPRLEAGKAIKDFSISYVTHGTLNVDKSNVILMAASTPPALRALLG